MGRMPAGQPTKYKPEYCDLAVETMANGKTLAGLARELMVARSTIYQWREDNPEFSDALEHGEDLRLAWWEEKMSTAAIDGKGNAALFKYLVNNQHRKDYSERQEIDVSGQVGVFEISYEGANYGDQEED